MNICRNCVFWAAHGSQYAIDADCRREPPKLFQEHSTYNDTAYTEYKSLWPRTKPDEWCGGFRQYVPPEPPAPVEDDGPQFKTCANCETPKMCVDAYSCYNLNGVTI